MDQLLSDGYNVAHFNTLRCSLKEAVTMRRQSSPGKSSLPTAVRARTPLLIGAREAERILGVRRTTLHRLVTNKELPAIFIDRPGEQRHWRIKRVDVLHLKERGVLRRRPPLKKTRVAWVRAFGPIPADFTVITRDGNDSNVDLENLALAPLKTLLNRARKASWSAHRRSKRRHVWTREMVATVRSEYATRKSEELARELNVGLSTLTRMARKLKLRKSMDHLKQRPASNRLPIGTERVHDRVADIVQLKVSYVGKFHTEQWRPKHHVVWEQATGHKVPRGFRVIFKDGNKRNFDPSNLELATREEISALAFAKYLSYPASLRAAIKLTGKLQREIQRQRDEREAQPLTHRTKRRRSVQRRWSPQMDTVLCRDYPTKPIAVLLATLGVSMQSIRNRARRLGVRRSPGTIIAEAHAAAAIEKAHAFA